MMDNVMKGLEKYLIPIGSKLAQNKVLSAMRDGIAAVMPIVMVGSLALIIKNFPTPGANGGVWATWLAGDGAWLSDWLLKLYYGTFMIIGIVAAFGIAYHLAKELGADGLSAGVISFASFVITTPYMFGTSTPWSLTAKSVKVTNLAEQGMSFNFTGANGLFPAILIGLFTGYVFAWFVKRHITIKMPDTVPPAVANSFVALIPGLVILTFWDIVQTLLARTDFKSLSQILTIWLQKPLSAFGGSLFGVIVVATLTSLFWFVGVHGGNITGAIMSPVYLSMMGANAKAYAAHQTMPNIVTQPFMDLFVYLGGGGATLGLVIAITLFSHSKQLKTLKPLTMVPGIFNINEPTMFGIPVVLNVYLILPFIVVPIMNALIAFTAMQSGIVAMTNGAVMPWTTPPIISGFLATGGHISGSILQVVLIVLDTLVWLPFMKITDKRQIEVEKNEKIGAEA
ncbi:PTS sugar transporter subunit IIC [Oenococcus sicerae]|nr:PTS sugar transporter subunit IIC [Oenococcus sicerae]